MVPCSTFVDAYAKLVTDVGDRKLWTIKTNLIGEISQNVSKNLDSLQPYFFEKVSGMIIGFAFYIEKHDRTDRGTSRNYQGTVSILLSKYCFHMF